MPPKTVTFSIEIFINLHGICIQHVGVLHAESHQSYSVCVLELLKYVWMKFEVIA